MKDQIYKFTPIGSAPNIKKIQKELFLIVIVIALVCSVATIFTNANSHFLSLYAFIILTAFIIMVKYTTKYILDLKIDVISCMLELTYLSMNGKIGVTKINIKTAKYTYGYRINKWVKTYVLILKAKDDVIQINEERWKDGSSKSNAFTRNQLEQMNEIILEIRKGMVQ